MDFDPSEFLAMAMSEDTGAVYTAPDLAEPHPGVVTTVEGLQMEQGLHIPVPTFGALDDGFYENGSVDSHYVNGETSHDTPEPVDHGSPSQLSPVERTNSPHPVTKKIIPTTFDETRFRKDFFAANYERVKLFRLHCTICDKHLGCAPYFTVHHMRTHKLLSVCVCRKCHDFYGDINFPVEEDSEIYCCWCGQGGELFCCSACPKTVCKKCIKQNFGDGQVKKIDENDNWKCFVCDPADIYPHRAMYWGLQRYCKEMRQRVSSFGMEEKTEYLSKDFSHCCPIDDVQWPPITIPFRLVMSKVPICIIAEHHRAAVLINQTINPNLPTAKNNIAIQQTNQNLQQTANTQMVKVRTPNTSLLKNHLGIQPRPASASGASPQRFHTVNSPAPYPVSRPAPYPVPRPAPYPVPRPVHVTSRQTHPHPARTYTPSPLSQKRPIPYFRTNEVIDLVEQSPPPKEPHPSQTSHSEINIGWLDKGVNDVYNTLMSMNLMITQFRARKNELKNDFEKLTAFSDQLSHHIKISICNLAKINQDMVDARKVVIDDHVSSVVSNIRASVVSAEVHMNSLVRPSIALVHQRPQTTPTFHKEPEETDTPTSSQDEDMNDLSGGLPAALLCETVMEVEGNKENENSNKHSSRPTSRKPKPAPKSRTSMKGNYRKTQRQTIPVIDLIDDDEFDESYYCKKYKITPCKVVLTRCN